jgi:hypothetical protein
MMVLLGLTMSLCATAQEGGIDYERLLPGAAPATSLLGTPPIAPAAPAGPLGPPPPRVAIQRAAIPRTAPPVTAPVPVPAPQVQRPVAPAAPVRTPLARRTPTVPGVQAPQMPGQSAAVATSAPMHPLAAMSDYSTMPALGARPKCYMSGAPDPHWPFRVKVENGTQDHLQVLVNGAPVDIVSLGGSYYAANQSSRSALPLSTLPPGQVCYVHVDPTGTIMWNVSAQRVYSVPQVATRMGGASGWWWHYPAAMLPMKTCSAWPIRASSLGTGRIPRALFSNTMKCTAR